MDIVDQPNRGELFALVAYVSEPLRSMIDELKSSVSSQRPAPPHITLLPPRPLRTDPAIAYDRIREVLAEFPAFELELTEICQFPSTNVLYLAVGKGQSEVYEIYRALNQGSFRHKEEFEFLPHLTLACPADQVAAAEMRVSLGKAWNQVRHLQPIVIDRAAFLSRTIDGDWNQHGEHGMKAAAPRD